ncbi:MAG: flagellin [Deltaproteobacteria bacterium]|nr:flagellin [Deltaproteobacteria bacterium]
MAWRIQNNPLSLNAQRHLANTQSALAKSLERLSSGYRINRAADDAAGLAISSTLRADIASYKVGSQNASQANSILQVAEGGMDQISAMMVRLKELATQAASSNVSSSERTKINSEANELIDEIDRIADSTEYDGTNLLDGSFGLVLSGGSEGVVSGLVSVTGWNSSTQDVTIAVATVSATKVKITITDGGNSQVVSGITKPGTGETSQVDFDAFGLRLTLNSNIYEAQSSTKIEADSSDTEADFQIGTSSGTNDRLSFSIDAVDSSGLSLSKDQLLNQSDARSFLDTIDTAVSTLANRRASIGANQNRLMYAAANLSTTIENFTASESVVRDADMAAEMSNFTKNQILLQSGTAMLAQANVSQQGILKLLG